MRDMTEEEYDALDERLTKNPPEIDIMGVGFFSHKGIQLIGLDENKAKKSQLKSNSLPANSV